MTGQSAAVPAATSTEIWGMNPIHRLQACERELGLSVADVSESSLLGMGAEAVRRRCGIGRLVGCLHRHAAGAGVGRTAGASLNLNVNGQFRNGFGEFVAGVPSRGDLLGDQAVGQVGVEDFPVIRFVRVVDEIVIDVVDDLLELVVILGLALAFGCLEVQGDVNIQDRCFLVFDGGVLDGKGERLLLYQAGHPVVAISNFLSVNQQCWHH